MPETPSERMSNHGSREPVPSSAAILPTAILVIFFVSGASALIDQIVWTRALYRIFGVTALAASTVLAAFMGGLAIGSYLFGRLIDRGGSALKLYALMELAIALITPLTPWAFRALQPLYSAMANEVGLQSPLLPVLRGILCLVVLLLPTLLMGGTLPVLAKAFLRNQPGRVTAALYSANTWGAVFGCFLAGFVLLGVLGETRSLLLAASGNLAVALWAWIIAGNSAEAQAGGIKMMRSGTTRQSSSKVVGVVLVVSGINGFAALALEVLWGRTLGLLTDASIYSFTAIIGMFLAGMAIGSRLTGPLADRTKSPLTVLGVLGMLMGLMVVVTVGLFTRWVPHQYLGGENGGTSFPDIWLPFRTMLIAAAAVAPMTILSGACFPLLARLVVTDDGQEGRQLGLVYSVNTVGGILGALAGGYVLLPLLADQGAFRAIALLYIAGAIVCLATAGRTLLGVTTAVVVAGLASVVLPLGQSLSRDLVQHYGSIHAHRESSAGTVSAYTLTPPPPPPLEKRLHVNGTGMTVLCTDTKFMAHLPLLLHPQPKSALVVCFGMGTTFRSASRHKLPVTVVELQPYVPKLFGFFHPDAVQLLNQPTNHVEIGDGRNFLLLSKVKYSVITVDPAPPMHSAGTVNLYTREFLELCRDHLDENGVMSLWIPAGSCMESDFRLILKTFTTVFDDYSLWRGVNKYGWYLIGSQGKVSLRPERLAALAVDESIKADVSEYTPGLTISQELLSWMLMSGKDNIDRYVQGETRTLTDDRPYTEFPWLTWITSGKQLRDEWMFFPLSEARLIER